MPTQPLFRSDRATQKHFDHFWEFHFEALEANGGQNAPEKSRKIPGKILTYLDTKKIKIRPL